MSVWILKEQKKQNKWNLDKRSDIFLRDIHLCAYGINKQDENHLKKLYLDNSLSV